MPHNAAMRILTLALPIVLLAGCVRPSAPPPPPEPTPTPTPAPVPPPPPPAVGDWRDWPVTPGDWSYRTTSTGSLASFGPRGAAPVLTLACERTGRRIVMTLPTMPAGRAIAVRTSSTVRSLATTAGAGGATVTLPANDTLLDAIGFSRGRFVLEAAPTARLVVPAWAEVLRVTEDCRR